MNPSFEDFSKSETALFCRPGLEFFLNQRNRTQRRKRRSCHSPCGQELCCPSEQSRLRAGTAPQARRGLGGTVVGTGNEHIGAFRDLPGTKRSPAVTSHLSSVSLFEASPCSNGNSHQNFPTEIFANVCGLSGVIKMYGEGLHF